MLFVQAAIEGHRSELAGQEVAFAKAIAADNKEGHNHYNGTRGNIAVATSKKDIDDDLQAHADRKKARDKLKTMKAREDCNHVSQLCFRVRC